MSKKTLPFHFKLTSIDTFECSFEKMVTGKFFNTIYEKSVKQLSEDEQKKLQEVEVRQFEVPKHMIPPIARNLSSFMKDVGRQVSGDGITILRWNVERCTFQKFTALKETKVNEAWYIKVTVKGAYSRC